MSSVPTKLNAAGEELFDAIDTYATHLWNQAILEESGGSSQLRELTAKSLDESLDNLKALLAQHFPANPNEETTP